MVVVQAHGGTLEVYQRPSGGDLSFHSYTNNVKKHGHIDEIRVPFKKRMHYLTQPANGPDCPVTIE